jgi:hypothetical protein
MALVAQTGIELTIQLPPPEVRPWGLLLDVASQLPSLVYPDLAANPQGRFPNGNTRATDRLGLGVQHQPWGCEPLKRGNSDCNPEYLLNGEGAAIDSQGDLVTANVDAEKSAALLGYEDLVVHPAFKVVDGVRCSVMSFPDDTSRNASMVNRLRNRMRVLLSNTVADELVSGWASGGPSLTSEATIVTPLGTGLAGAGAALEAALAASLHGATGTIHLPPFLVAAAIDSCWVHLINGRLVTSTGHVVAADSAYGASEVESGTVTIFASGPVFYRSSDTTLLGDHSHDTFMRDSNIRERIAELRAQLAFDPCAVSAVEVDLNDVFGTVGS